MEPEWAAEEEQLLTARGLLMAVVRGLDEHARRPAEAVHRVRLAVRALDDAEDELIAARKQAAREVADGS